MQDNQHHYYYSKLLLFGEYTVTIGGDALAIPFKKFKGKWSIDSQAEPDPTLIQLSAYLENTDNGLFKDFNSKKFTAAIQNGLRFDSNIPYGYGLGSSGALTAAVYDRFFIKNPDITVSDLRRLLGAIESYFHGASSGTDPLVSYLDKAVWIKKGNEVIVPEDFSFELSDHCFFLIDTGMSRSTAPLVNAFRNLLENNAAYRKEVEELTALNNLIIHQILSNNYGELLHLMQTLSEMQYRTMQAMIPGEYLQIWKEGLHSRKFLLKLCGAGGGGMLMGITQNYEELQQFIPESQLLLLKE